MTKERKLNLTMQADSLNGCIPEYEEWLSLPYRERKEFNFDYKEWLKLRPQLVIRYRGHCGIETE